MAFTMAPETVVDLEDDVLMHEGDVVHSGAGAEAEYDVEMAADATFPDSTLDDVLGDEPPLAEPGSEPPRRGAGFIPSDIFVGAEAPLAEALHEKFWTGQVFLARREQVEDPTWWKDNNVGVAVSANGGPFEHAVQGRRWFQYPEGALSMNVPIMRPDLPWAEVADRLMRAILMMMAMLASGYSVAIHCLNSRHRGPLLFMSFLVMLMKGMDQGDLDDDANVARRSAAIMARIKRRWPAISDTHVCTTWLADNLWHRRLFLFRHAVQMYLPDAFVGAAPAQVPLIGTDRLNPLWWRLLDCCRIEQLAPRQASFDLLATELTSGLVCGLPPAEYEAIVGKGGKGAARKGKAGPAAKARPSSGTGSQSKGKGGPKGTKGGHGEGKTAGSHKGSKSPKGSKSKVASSSGGHDGHGDGDAGKGSGDAIPDAEGMGGSSGSGGPSTQGAPRAKPRSRSVRARGAGSPPREQGRRGGGRGPLPALGTNSGSSGRLEAGSGPASSTASRSRSPAAGRRGGRHGLCESAAVRFSARDVRGRRVEFFRHYCELPEDVFLGRTWAATRHPGGWRPLRFLAQAASRCHLQAPVGSRLGGGLELLGGAESLLHAMLAGGCDLDARTDDTAAAAGFTALHLLAKPHHRWSRRESDDVLSLAEAILHSGGRVDPIAPRAGRTPLGIAASCGQEALVRLLVRCGADPAAPEGDGVTVIEAELLVELAARRAVGGDEGSPERPRPMGRHRRRWHQ